MNAVYSRCCSKNKFTPHSHPQLPKHKPMNVPFQKTLSLFAASTFIVLSAFAEDTAEPISFDFALYFTPEPATEPELELERLLKEEYPEFAGFGSVATKWLPTADYSPPDQDSFRYLSVGLEDSIAPALAAAERVFVLSFETTPKTCIGLNRYASLITADLAEATSGYPWDEECRLLYSRKAWRDKKVNTWIDGLPDIRGHVNMHAYRNPELVRIITLGMRKFDLPDLVITEVFSGSSRSAGNTLNYIAQHLLENPSENPFEFTLKLADLKHTGLRKDALTSPLEGAIGQIDIELVEGEWEEGDPNNIIAHVTFPEMDAETVTEQQSLAFSTLYGAIDEIQHVRSGDAAIAAASKHAQAKFLTLKPHFEKGLDPNERLIVKYGFPVNGSNEFMWVEVLKWKKNHLEGILLNDSYYDEKLRGGKRVKVPIDEVFDYIHYKPDGTSEGNETGKLIQQMQGN